jgi:long-subunit acyl-CoA synthetase (AMP-forming)
VKYTVQETGVLHGLLTRTQKIRRREIYAAYKIEIEKLYQVATDVALVELVR